MVKKGVASAHVVLVTVVAALALVALGAFVQYSLTKGSDGLVGRVVESNLPDKHKAQSVREFVEAGVKKAQDKGISNQALFKELDKERSPVGGYMIGYQTKTDPNAAIGTQVLHGVSTKDFCDANHPMCNDKQSTEIGKDLYDFKTLNGVYEVRFWIKIAREGGGWIAYYWKNGKGEIVPKYVYIRGVPSRNILLASGYFG